MKARFLFLVVRVLAAVGGVSLWPRSVSALNPNHQCAFCHNVHGATGPALTREPVTEALCLSCHGPGGISVLKADVHKNSDRSQYPPFRISCRGCHDAHKDRQNWLVGTNLELVGTKQDSTGIARILTPNSGVREVVFESRGRDVGEPTLHSFADADEDGNGYYDGVCETCHTLTKHHRNNPSGGHAHNRGRTCVLCHEHVMNFIP